MSTGRISNSRNKTSKKTGIEKADASLHRFIGLSLSGGKSDKACLAVIEYFPQHKKVFLARLFERIKSEVEISADLKIIELVHQYGGQVDSIAIDAPLSLPTCINCQLKCPGYEACEVSQIKWMREQYLKISAEKKPKKHFTPYTQRCAEVFLSFSLEEAFEIQHGLGANMAPLAARALFLKKRLQYPLIEVAPKVSIWRLGMGAKVGKSHLRSHRHAVGGDESRRLFLEAMSQQKNIFIYQQDLRAMVENNHAFEAFIAAYTGFLRFKKQTEMPPKSFPKNESWIVFPKSSSATHIE